MKRTLQCGWFVLIAVLTVGLPQEGRATVRTWSSGSGNWNDSASWSGSVAPTSGDDVVISGGTVTLTNSTFALNSFTNSAALVFDGGSGFGTNIALIATRCTILSGGSITHNVNLTTTTNALGVWVPSNRVWIVCSDFFLATNGNINVNGLGYMGRTNEVTGSGGPGAGPGGGIGDKSINGTEPWRGGGGGYGGRGGDTDQGYGRAAAGGAEYGSSNAPVDPGSGGGVIAPNYGAGGNGGGAVCIQAAGTVTILGTISADGTAGATYDGGGSGGSIFITCDSFTGSANGLLSAKGGSSGPNQGGGGGAGGRIAVIYGAGQTVNPGVRFDTSYGLATSPGYPGDAGTVFFPHNGILQQPIAAGRLDGWLFKNVRLFIPGFTTWASPSLTVSNCVVTFAQPGFSLSVPDTLTIAGSGSLGGLESGPHQLTCTNLFVNTSGTFALGTNWTVTCSNLIVSGSGTLTLSTNATVIWGLQNVVLDGGNFTLGPNSTIAGFAGDVIVKNNGSVNLGLQSLNLTCNQITVTNGGNLNLYLSSLSCTSIVARGTGAKDTGNIRLYYLPCVDCASIVLTNGGSLAVWAAATNWTGQTYGTLVNVQGDLMIAPTSWLYPWPYMQATDTGTTVFIQANNIQIAAGGGIDADSKGYAKGGFSHDGYGPGKGYFDSPHQRGAGGGHGGKGGNMYGAGGGATNDSLTVPTDLGSSGAQTQAYTGGNGGGAVRLQAEGTVTLDGTITANAGLTGIFSGGSAGGTIYVYCRQFAGAATGIMCAKGSAGGTTDGGGGGGGRIAVWRQIHTYAGTPTLTDNGTSVTNGVGYANGSDGTVGTVRWITIPPRGMLILGR